MVVVPLLVCGALVVCLLLWVGVRLLVAGRQLGRRTGDQTGDRTGHHAAGSARVPVAPDGSVAATVDARLERARAAVETLVMPEVDDAELRPSPGAFRDRAQTYGVLGAGLLGLAAMLVGGFLLLV